MRMRGGGGEAVSDVGRLMQEGLMRELRQDVGRLMQENARLKYDLDSWKKIAAETKSRAEEAEIAAAKADELERALERACIEMSDHVECCPIGVAWNGCEHDGEGCDDVHAAACWKRYFLEGANR